MKIQRSFFGLVTMTNVDGLIAPKRILGDIRGVVSHSQIVDVPANLTLFEDRI